MAYQGDFHQNNVEWLTQDARATASFTQKKWVNRFMKYASERDDVQIVAQNADGSICVRFPTNWVKLSPPPKGREFTDEERAAAVERLRIARENRNKNKES